MARWLASGSQATFQTGETIFQQGTPGSWAYLVLEGKVRVVRTTAGGRDVALGTMSAGEVFGEYALLRPGLNTATCRAAAASRLLRLPLAPLTQFLLRRPEVAADLKDWLRLHALIQYLRGQPFLGFLSATSALKHLAYLESVTIGPWCSIQANGLSDGCWHFLEHGRAILKEEGDTPGRELGPGDWFGGQALIERGTVPAVVALTEVKCWRLTRDAFQGKVPSPAPSSHLQTFRQQPGPPPRFEWVGQQQEVDCGFACLAMIARSRGLPVTVAQLRDRLCPGKAGVSLMELQQLAQAIGLPCTAIRIGPEQWGHLRLPALVHLKEGHFVVLFHLEVTGAQVGDPATGLLTQSLASFREKCSGSVLVFTPPRQMPAHIEVHRA
jgi:ATP-binding cassette subfamily B protein